MIEAIEKHETQIGDGIWFGVGLILAHAVLLMIIAFIAGIVMVAI